MSKPLVIALAILHLVGCTARNAQGKEDRMTGLMYQLFRDAHIVVLAKPRSMENNVWNTVCSHVFKGKAHIGESIHVKIPPAGKDTPELTAGQEYLLVLDQGENGAFTVLKLSNPVEIPPGKRSVIAELVHEYVNISEIPTEKAGTAIQALVLKLITSGIPLFELDGSKLAGLVQSWHPENMKRLVDLAEGTETTHSLRGMPLQNVINAIIVKSDIRSLGGFIVEQAGRGNGDDIYYGLLGRPAADITELLTPLLDPQKTESDVLVELLRIAGLLRRTDLLDTFEKAYPPAKDSELAGSLARARELVNR